MREVSFKEVENAVYELSLKANFSLRKDVKEALEKALSEENSLRAQKNLQILLENARLAEEEKKPICQDTGVVSVFVEVGKDILLPTDFKRAVNEGVSRAYKEGFLRKSIVKKALFERENTQDNTPAFIHFDFSGEEGLRITVMPKGAGSENVSFMEMLLPHEGSKGLKERILPRLRKVIPFACPPVILGICAGATFEKAPLYAKKSLLEKVGRKNPDERLSELEREILEEVNSWGIGPGALGGKTTALAVHLVELPTHMASLPVAVSISCHALRSASKLI